MRPSTLKFQEPPRFFVNSRINRATERMNYMSKAGQGIQLADENRCRPASWYEVDGDLRPL